MTIIAGLMSRNGARLPRPLCEALVSNLSRHPEDVVEMFEGDQWLLAKVDIGAFGAKASVHVPNGPVLVLAGEPLLTQGEGTIHRTRELETQRLFESLCSGTEGALRDATGVFCAAFYSPQTHTLTLVADKLSLRPIYYAVTPELVAFSSALRLLEAIGLCAGDIDLRGTYESAAFGCPLGDRTCYARVRTIQPADIIRVSSASEAHSRYFQWDRLEDPGLTDDQLIHELIARFDAAIRKRLRGDKVTVSFLSGGLDSRAIVAALRSQDVKVFTVNFAPPNTQDRVFAALAAQALRAIHYQIDVPLSAAANVYRKEHLRKWFDSTTAPVPRPERPQCLWSGDGGSVGVGHVYMNEGAVNALEHGDVEEGIRAYLRYNGVAGPAKSVMTAAVRSRTAGWLIDSIRGEIDAVRGRPDGRALHLFLMFNDQRRHLAEHFENIDIERFEFHLPFFDSRFLEVILRAPVKPFLRHSLYNRWLNALSPAAASVPWQAYPNHEPCPVPFEGELRYQWGDYWGQREDRRLARRLGAQAVRHLFAQPFPSHLISRGRFGAAILLSMLGVTSYGHVVRVGTVFTKHWQRSHRAGFARIESGSR